MAWGDPNCFCPSPTDPVSIHAPAQGATLWRRHNYLRSKEILDLLECKGEDKLLVFSPKSAIVIKRVGSAPLAERFDRLADVIEARFRERGVSEKDVQEAVTWGRK